MPGFPVFTKDSKIYSTVHLTLELFSVFISTIVVLMAFHGVNRSFSHVTNTIIIGFTAVAGLDLIHALSYDGFPLMNSENTTQKSVFFWFSGRWVELLTITLVVLKVNFPLSRGLSLAIGFAIVLFFLFLGTEKLHLFPELYIQNQGVTPLKAQLEYLLTGCYLSVAGIFYWRFRKGLQHLDIYLAYACFFMALGELSLSRYTHVGDFNNLLGHIFKIVSYLLIYRATFFFSIREPYELLQSYQQKLSEQKLDLKTLLDNLPMGVLHLDRELNCRYLSPSMPYVHNHNSALGMKIHDILPTKFINQIDPKLYEALAGRKVELTLDYLDNDKTIFNVITIVPSLDEKQQVKGIVMLITDVTERELSQRKLIESLQEIAELKAALDAHAIVAVTDAHGTIIRVNDKFCSISKYSREELIGKNHRIINSGYHTPSFFMDLWRTISRGEVWNGEICNKAKDGSLYWVHTTIVPFLDHSRKPVQYIAIRADITNRKNAEQEVHRMAFHDELTGLPNRRLMRDRLTHAIENTSKAESFSALLMLDLDNFKEVNDTLGHAQGDELLRQVATRLLSSVKQNDIVARFGGDEFVILLTNLASDLETASFRADERAEKIREYLADSYELNGQKVNTPPSIGIALFHKADEDSDELLKQADMALYTAKESGRNCVYFFDPSIQEEITERAKLVKELRQAINQEELRLLYQPIVDRKRNIVGVEALLRWQHPKRGLLSPLFFIDIAEKTNLILPIGQWVLKTACMQLQSWSDDPIKQFWTVAVNVSAKQFQEQQFVEKVVHTTRQTGADPKLLRLELTESLMQQDINQTIAKMIELQDAGIRFSLDDFGTDYSSLSYLNKLPLNVVKIDRSFVRDILTNHNDATITKTILSLVNTLELSVVAEGVETEEQFNFLLAHDCSHFQGYLFGKPATADVF